STARRTITERKMGSRARKSAAWLARLRAAGFIICPQATDLDAILDQIAADAEAPRDGVGGKAGQHGVFQWEIGNQRGRADRISDLFLVLVEIAKAHALGGLFFVHQASRRMAEDDVTNLF